MKRLIRWLIILGILGGGAYAASGPIGAYLKERRRINYRQAEVSRGTITAVVNSTGTIKPIRSVAVGTFVSGPIAEIYVDFNDDVKKDQLLAIIDPRLYDASVARDEATLATRAADVLRVKAQLQQATNDEARSKSLRAENRTFISDAEMDQFRFKKLALDAELTVAEASVKQAKANLETSVANQNYTKIVSPVDGVIIDRKVDPGQTVAASYQTPELFTVAPDMRKEMRVYASVDEADIGLIRKAQEAGKPVRFTVDAYPDDLFEGTIYQIRKNSTTTQNVVTFPVIVSAPNAELKLLPGMTASLSFPVGEAKDALRIPNAALRFYPVREQVRPQDRPLLETSTAAANGNASGGGSDDDSAATQSATDKAESRRERSKRHVWVTDGDFLRAVTVVTGVSDSKYTQMVSGELKEGHKLVTGIQPRE